VRIAGLLALAALVAATFAVRTVLVLALRRRHPGAAAAVDRWWAWVPLAVVLVVMVVTAPLLGIPLAVATAWWLTRAGAVGSPFRPRG
jgi:hypothetical protein